MWFMGFFFLLNIDVIKNQFLNFLCVLCLGNYKFLIDAIFKIGSITVLVLNLWHLCQISP